MRSSTTELSIAVVGAGIAGLSVAAFLARAGYPCTVYEQAVELTEVGAGIQVSPNGSVLLHRIGLAGHLADAALRPEAIEQRSWHGGLVARTAPGTTYGAPYYTLHKIMLVILNWHVGFSRPKKRRQPATLKFRTMAQVSIIP